MQTTLIKKDYACPFCGSVKVFQTWEEFGSAFIMCAECGACGPQVVGDHPELAMPAWEKRYSSLEPREVPGFTEENLPMGIEGVWGDNDDKN